MREHLELWLQVMVDGARSAPRQVQRDPQTVRLHIMRIAPIVTAWAEAGYQWFAEVTPDDIAAALLPEKGTRRHFAIEVLTGDLNLRPISLPGCGRRWAVSTTATQSSEIREREPGVGGVWCAEIVNPASSKADRAVGALLGLACGDALGVHYEFGPTLDDGALPEMKGGGLGSFAPGEWSDDTSMAIAVAEGLLSGDSLEGHLDAIAERFLIWHRGGPADVGIQTRAVLDRTARRLSETNVRPAEVMGTEAHAYSHEHVHSAGNGALMRTAPVALAYLENRQECARAARAVAQLTHADPLAGDSCVLWTEATRAAVAGEGLELLWGLDLLPPDRRHQWRAWIEDALSASPNSFSPNGFTVTALQAAWAAIKRAKVEMELGLTTAIRIGDDTDTVAAIAGSLLGGYLGEKHLPSPWLMSINGWPGYRCHDLVDLAMRLAGVGKTASLPGGDAAQQRTVQHPHDDGVFVGNAFPDTCTAVVDLRISTPPEGAFGDRPVAYSWYFPERGPHMQEPFLAHAAQAIRDLRLQGQTVFVRFPFEDEWPVAVAMAYSTLLGHNVRQAWEATWEPWPWARSWEILFFSVRDLAEDYWGVRPAGQ